MKLHPHDVEKIASLTLEHYNLRAEDFREGTRDHDVSQNIAALLSHIEGEPPFTILDFGCGPCRDRTGRRRALRRDGAHRHRVRRVATGFPQARSAGRALRWCIRQRVAVSCAEPGIAARLRQLLATLKPGGVLFSSNPRGANEEGWNRGRYGAYHDLQTWRRVMSGAGLVELDHYYRPAGLPREQQPWLASVWRRPVS